METLDLAILAAAAFATSILSAVVGMAGGITLLAVMLLFLEPLTVRSCRIDPAQGPLIKKNFGPEILQSVLGRRIVMAIEAGVDLISHLPAMLHEDIHCGGMRGTFEQQVLLDRLDISQKGLHEYFDLVEGDYGFELQNDSINRSGYIETAHSEAYGQDDETS